jgi:ubiquinone/menaquinone biosynthesis C-methylase UbiE
MTGRFASTVALYEKFRPPYPPLFFREVAARLPLGKKHALIDLGTGPGLLALGFAPYVGRITGVDPETGMIAAAREAAARAAQAFTLIEGKAETLAEDIGRFDVVTIGRALHWMDRDAVLARLDRLLAADGAILVCASFSARDGRNAWLDDYNTTRHAWSNAALLAESGRGERTHRDLAEFFRGTRFRVTEAINVETSHNVGIADLAQRVLTFSSSSPQALGDKADAMLRDVEARLAPFSHDGRIDEIVISSAQVIRG